MNVSLPVEKDIQRSFRYSLPQAIIVEVARMRMNPGCEGEKCSEKCGVGSPDILFFFNFIDGILRRFNARMALNQMNTVSMATARTLSLVSK